MGLDMFLYREKYLGGMGDKVNQKEAKTLKERLRVRDDDERYPKGIMVTAECAYWRKANHIHKYFVDHHGDGVDECQRIWVSIDDIVKLRDVCKKVFDSIELVDGKINNGYHFDDKGKKIIDWVDGKVIKNTKVCEELLPTQGGFFFGSTEYDEYYAEDIERTIQLLDEVIETDKGEFDYYYQASW